jgi:hypothetical protein
VEKGMAVRAGDNRRVQVRKVQEWEFTEAKKQVFLDHLAGCSNVTHSAAAAGVSVKTVNNHRLKDPVFAQRYREALDVGYDTLEAALVAAAARRGRYEPGPDADAVPGPESLDKDLALHLLRLRHMPLGQRGGQGNSPPLRRASEKELNEAILAQLDVLARRLRGKKGPSTGSGPTA